ncbi:hypothetical protein KCP75_24880 [Salmonella enterica subsp. enterica]|nr:hypothetical protein KCP75_24880 [Salmonella enterica subsp. enterica]
MEKLRYRSTSRRAARKLIQSGELNIDVAFLGVPCCDEFIMLTLKARQASRCGFGMQLMRSTPNVVLLTEEGRVSIIRCVRCADQLIWTCKWMR